MSSASPPPSPLQPRFSLHGLSSHSSIPTPHLRFPGVANLLLKMRQSRHKSHRIESSSGEEPRTHPTLAREGALVTEQTVPLYTEEKFVCRDGVDVVKLLRATRAFLLERAEAIGANALVNEQWFCTVCGPHKRDGSYKVYVRYSACAARSNVRDPQKPPALENARGVPGLMTVLSRDE